MNQNEQLKVSIVNLLYEQTQVPSNDLEFKKAIGALSNGLNQGTFSIEIVKEIIRNSLNNVRHELTGHEGTLTQWRNVRNILITQLGIVHDPVFDELISRWEADTSFYSARTQLLQYILDNIESLEEQTESV